MTAPIGARKARVTLLGEEVSVISGGRQQVSRPLIGDVWASISDQTTRLEQKGGRQSFHETVSFQLLHRQAFLEARYVQLGAKRFRIRAIHKSSGLMSTLRFDAVLQPEL